MTRHRRTNAMMALVVLALCCSTWWSPHGLVGDDKRINNSKGSGSKSTEDVKVSAPSVREEAVTPKNISELVVTAPIGIWTRDSRAKGVMSRITVQIKNGRLVLKAECLSGEGRCNFRVDADYHINKESCLYGVIDGIETDFPGDHAMGIMQLSGQPFAIRFRVEDGALTLKDFKGFGIGVADSTTNQEQINRLTSLLTGRFTALDPAKPQPPLNADGKGMTDGMTGNVPYPTPHYLQHVPQYFPPDPPLPLEQERDSTPVPKPAAKQPECQSETEWWKGWFNRHPDPRATERIHGGIMQTTPKIKDEKTINPLEPPADTEVLAAWNRKEAGYVTAVSEKIEDDIIIAKNLVSWRNDPLTHPVRLYTAKWDCAVSRKSDVSLKPKVERVQIETKRFLFGDSAK